MNSTLLLDYWKAVSGYEGVYEVSVSGYVRRQSTGQFLRTCLNEKGYRRVTLSNKNKQRRFFVHRLVMAAFVGIRPPDKEVNHRSGWKISNRLSNLEYVTPQENIDHAVALGRIKRLTKEQVAEIRALEGSMSRKAIAAHFGVSDWTVRMAQWRVFHRGDETP